MQKELLSYSLSLNYQNRIISFFSLGGEPGGPTISIVFLFSKKEQESLLKFNKQIVIKK